MGVSGDEMIVKTFSEVSSYESNGAELAGLDPRPKIKVESHWNHDSRVVIEVEGTRLTVMAADLIDAIRRCSR